MRCQLINKTDLTSARFDYRLEYVMRVDLIPFLPMHYIYYVGTNRALELLAESLSIFPLVKRCRIVHIDNLHKIL